MRRFGLPEEQPEPFTLKLGAPAAAPGAWQRENVEALIRGVGDGASLKLLRYLLDAGDPVPTTQVAEALGLDDPKPLGSMVATVRRTARSLDLEEALLSEFSPDGRRLFSLSPGFRAGWEAIRRR